MTISNNSNPSYKIGFISAITIFVATLLSAPLDNVWSAVDEPVKKPETGHGELLNCEGSSKEGSWYCELESSTGETLGSWVVDCPENADPSGEQCSWYEEDNSSTSPSSDDDVYDGSRQVPLAQVQEALPAEPLTSTNENGDSDENPDTDTTGVNGQLGEVNEFKINSLTSKNSVSGSDSQEQDDQSVQSIERSPTGYCIPRGTSCIPCDPGLPIPESGCVPQDTVTDTPLNPDGEVADNDPQEQEKAEPQIVRPGTVLEETVPSEEEVD